MKKANLLAVIIALSSLVVAIVGFVVNRPAGGAAESEKTIQYVMYIGTNDKDTYEPKYTQEEAREIVDKICLSNFEGYTLQEATGSWVDEKNNITHEYTIVCYFDGADKETVYKTADEIIVALNQNTVLIERSEIDMDYYGGK